MPKFKYRHTKYKIYKKLRSDITGEILLKYKIDRLTVFILKNFEYKLTKLRNNFKKWVSIFSPQNKVLRDIRFPFIRIKEFDFLNSLLVRKTYNTEIPNLFSNAGRIRRKLMRIWTIKQKQKAIIKNYWASDPLEELEIENPLDINSAVPSFMSNFENSDHNKKFESNQNNSENLIQKDEIDDELDGPMDLENEVVWEDTEKDPALAKFYPPKTNTNFRGLILNKSDQKFVRLNWLNIQLIEKKFAHFYGFKSIPRFKLLQDSAFYCNKLRANGIFKLEGMMSVLLFRLNFATTVYQCRNILRTGIFLVNGLRIFNPTFRIKLFDDISTDSFENVQYVSDFLYSRLTERGFFLNVPDYIEINYRIFHACFWRYPLKNEIFGPYNFPFGKSPHDWSSSTIGIRR